MKPFIRHSRLILQEKNPVGVFILNENDTSENVLPKFRKTFRGVWYYIVPRLFKIRDRIIRHTIRDFNWVRKSKFYPIPANSFRKQKNVIFDITEIFSIAREKFPPRHPFYDKLIKSTDIFKNRKTFLFYTINLNKPIHDFMHTLIYPILYNIKKNVKDSDKLKSYPDNIIFVLVSGSKRIYIPVIVDKDYSTVDRALSFLRRVVTLVRPGKTSSSTKKEIENQLKTTDVVNTEIVSSTIVNSLPGEIKKDKEETGTVNAPKLVFALADKIIPNSVAGQFEPIPQNKVKNAVSKIVPFKPVTTKTSPIGQILDGKVLPKLPVNTLDKFVEAESKNVVKTVINLANTFELSDLQLKVVDYKVEDVPIKENEVAPSYLQRLTLEITDKFGKRHKVSMFLPKILNDGSYFVYGNKYITVKQIYPIPIIFPKKGVGRYSSFTTTITLQKQKHFTVVHIVGTKIPIGILLCYFFGFQETLDRYGIKVSLEKSETGTSFKVQDNKYLTVLNYDDLNEVQKDFINSLTKFKGINEIKSEFPSREYFEEFISLYTGNPDIPKKIDYVLKIAVDNRTREILKEKGLPTTLFDIFRFMHTNVLRGYVSDRNSLTETRIRAHEALAHIAFDELRKAVANYYIQVSKGKEGAKLKLSPESVLSAIITSSSFQLMEYVNPIEELQQHFKVTYSGYNGIPKDAVSDKLRAIHKTAYGTIDPIDVPVGASIGVVQHFTMNQILTYNGSVIPKEISDDIGNNILSFSTASIPFVSRNEPTRVMMGSNQSRQSVPLKESQPPIVQTGVESVIPSLLKSDVFLSKAPCSGVVTSVTDKLIQIRSKDGKTCKIDITPRIGRSGQGYSALIKKTPIVRKGQKVNEGDILTDSNAVKNGITSYGKNLVTAYMFWKGYTYEDGVVISEDVVNSMTSVHAIQVSTFVDEQDRITWINPKLKVGNTVDSGEELVKITGYRYLDLLDSGVIDEDNLIIFGNKYKLVSPYKGKILDVKFYFSGIDTSVLSPDVLQTLDKMSINLSSEYLYKGKKYKGVFIKIYVEVEKPLEIGDKLTNRHASKGVVCLIEPVKNMPRLPDGRHVQVIINPMSYINRTNVGQLYELYVGEIGYQLLQRMSKLSRKKFLALLGKVMLNLDKKFYGSSVYSYLSSCSDQQYKQFIKFCKDCNGFPIVVPPFAEPSYENIKKAMDILKIPEKYNCTMPDGSKKKIVAGMQYILKLEHMSSHKVFSRSLGPYQRKTGQPTQGKARGGGQRLGEGDVWSLLSWGADNVLKEFFSAGSDDFRMKQQLVRSIIENGSASLEILKEGEQQSKQLVDALFKGIMLSLV